MRNQGSNYVSYKAYLVTWIERKAFLFSGSPTFPNSLYAGLEGNMWQCERASVAIHICLCFAWKDSPTLSLLHTSAYTSSTLLSQQSNRLFIVTRCLPSPLISLWKHTRTLSSLHQQPHWSKTLALQLNLEQAPATTAAQSVCIMFVAWFMQVQVHAGVFAVCVSVCAYYFTYTRAFVFFSSVWPKLHVVIGHCCSNQSHDTLHQSCLLLKHVFITYVFVFVKLRA